MSSRLISDLRPFFRIKVNQFLMTAGDAGLDILIYCTLRDNEEQAHLYAMGRTQPGKIVTNAKPGESAHNYGLAFDGAPLIQGRIAWDDHPHWAIYGQIALETGLEWAGTWKSFQEFPHIQVPYWRTHIQPVETKTI